MEFNFEYSNINYECTEDEKMRGMSYCQKSNNKAIDYYGQFHKNNGGSHTISLYDKEGNKIQYCVKTAIIADYICTTNLSESKTPNNPLLTLILIILLITFIYIVYCIIMKYKNQDT